MRTRTGSFLKFLSLWPSQPEQRGKERRIQNLVLVTMTWPRNGLFVGFTKNEKTVESILSFLLPCSEYNVVDESLRRKPSVHRDSLGEDGKKQAPLQSWAGPERRQLWPQGINPVLHVLPAELSLTHLLALVFWTRRWVVQSSQSYDPRQRTNTTASPAPTTPRRGQTLLGTTLRLWWGFSVGTAFGITPSFFDYWTLYIVFFFVFCFCFALLCFLGPHPRHGEVPRLGEESNQSYSCWP